jgi:hypothetical protein
MDLLWSLYCILPECIIKWVAEVSEFDLRQVKISTIGTRPLSLFLQNIKLLFVSAD